MDPYKVPSRSRKIKNFRALDWILDVLVSSFTLDSITGLIFFFFPPLKRSIFSSILVFRLFPSGVGRCFDAIFLFVDCNSHQVWLLRSGDSLLSHSDLPFLCLSDLSFYWMQHRPSSTHNAPFWTTNSGAPVWNNNSSLTVGSRGNVSSIFNPSHFNVIFTYLFEIILISCGCERFFSYFLLGFIEGIVEISVQSNLLFVQLFVISCSKLFTVIWSQICFFYGEWA